MFSNQLIKPIPAHPPKALLVYRYMEFNNIMLDSQALYAKDALSTWRPNLPMGWSYLGQAASPDYETYPLGVIVRETQPGVLKNIVDWELVWSNEGVEKSKATAYALWRGIPPSDEYAVVGGGIFSDNPGWAPPDHNQAMGIKAIRKDVLVQFDGAIDTTRTLVATWRDKKSGAARDGAVWTIVPTDTSDANHACCSLAMIPASDIRKGSILPPAENCYVFSPDKAYRVE